MAPRPLLTLVLTTLSTVLLAVLAVLAGENGSYGPHASDDLRPAHDYNQVTDTPPPAPQVTA